MVSIVSIICSAPGAASVAYTSNGLNQYPTISPGGTSTYAAGNTITEADWRLFTTLIRFDAVYYSHFKCNWRHIAEYPNLSNYLRDLYQVPGVAETTSLEQIKRHYYFSQRQVNPTGIVPVGPQLDFAAKHDRGRFG